jgi:hypothetical protein
MNKRIEEHVEKLFAGTPPEPKIMEIKEELLADLNDKYQDLLAGGKSDEEAYAIVISGIGDINDLLRPYIGSGPFSSAEAERKHNLGSIFISIGVAGFVLSLSILFLFAQFGLAQIGMALMFLFLAISAGLAIYGGNILNAHYQKRDASFVEQYKEKATEDERSRKLQKAVNSAIWPLIVVIYLAVSYVTWRWDITWIIFLVGASVQQFITMRFLATPATKGKYWYGMFWTAVCVVYFITSYTFAAWRWSWIIFVAAAAVQQIIRLIGMWGEKA